MWSVLRDSTGQLPLMVKFSKERLPQSFGLHYSGLLAPGLDFRLLEFRVIMTWCWAAGLGTCRGCLYFKAWILSFFSKDGHIVMYEQIVNSWHLSSTYAEPWLSSALKVTSLSNQDPEQCPAHGEGSINISVMNELSTTTFVGPAALSPVPMQWNAFCSNAMKIYWERGKKFNVQTTWSSNSHPRNHSKSQEGKTINFNWRH